MEPHPHHNPCSFSPISLDIDWQDIMVRLIEVVLPRCDDIMDSPVKLGALLAICVELKELEEPLRQRAETLALQRGEIPGWTLVRQDSKSYVETDDVIEFLLSCSVLQLPPVLTTLAKQIGHLSGPKFIVLCEAAGLLEPPADSIKSTGAKVFLRRNSRETSNKKS